MRMSYKQINELREELHKHNFNVDHVNYAIELIVGEDTPHPKTNNFSDILSFAIKSIREEYPDAGKPTSKVRGGPSY